MAPSKMHGIEVPLDDAVAQRMGFVNLAAFEEYRTRRHLPDADSLLKDLCNIKQSLVKYGKCIIALQDKLNDLEGRLAATGTEKIG